MTIGHGHVLAESHDETTCEACLHPWGPPKTLREEINDARRFLDNMARELRALSERAEGDSDDDHDELRAETQFHLEAIVAAYDREHPPASSDGDPF